MGNGLVNIRSRREGGPGGSGDGRRWVAAASEQPQGNSGAGTAEHTIMK